ncbi:MAG: enoyl-CoA hydratase-related protein [bacterium]
MVDYGRYEFIRFEKEGRILSATLNRPESLNSISARMHVELAEMFLDFGRDDESDVMTLTGAGRGFCSGADLKGGLTQDDPRQAAEAIFRDARKLIHAVVETDKPILAAVNGPAAGLGVTLALFCDIVIASDRARLGDTHVKVGLAAGDGGAVIWPLLVGVNKAKELLMTGEMLDAQEALRIGLVNQVVAHDDLQKTVREKAQKLASGNTFAIRATKRAVNAYLKWMVNQVFDLSLVLEKMSYEKLWC